MLLTDITFEPRDDVSREQLEDAVLTLTAAWFKNGQIWGDPITGWVRGNLRVVSLLPDPAALDERHGSPWVRRESARVGAFTRRKFQWRVLDDRAESHRANDWTCAESLVLFTHRFDRTSPIATEKRQPVPLFRIPVDEATREELIGWMGEYADLDGVQLGCGALEIAAYTELASPTSTLSRTGRQLAAAVEHATGKETFYYLMRHWGRPDEDRSRRCPGCGSDWAVPTLDSEAPTRDFPFRCTPCRLVSDQASDTDDDAHAHIGEWSHV